VRQEGPQSLAVDTGTVVMVMVRGYMIQSPVLLCNDQAVRERDTGVWWEH